MILYHGSNLNVVKIDLSKCRPGKDFGKGFYVTELREQAEKKWIDFDALVKGMTYRDTTSQYSFHTERAIRLLHKVGTLE